MIFDLQPAEYFSSGLLGVIMLAGWGSQKLCRCSENWEFFIADGCVEKPVYSAVASVNVCAPALRVSTKSLAWTVKVKWRGGSLIISQNKRPGAGSFIVLQNFVKILFFIENIFRLGLADYRKRHYKRYYHNEYCDR